VTLNDAEVAEIELDADRNEETTVELKLLIVVTNDDEAAVRALDEDTNDRTTLELSPPIELDADKNDAVAETSTEEIRDVNVLNEDVAELMTLTREELNEGFNETPI